MTGGSTSVASTFQILRHAGATVRFLLTQVAAKRWSVSPESCRASEGRIYHPLGELSFSFAELAQEASRTPLPDEVPLKNPQDFKLIGKAFKRLDGRLKVSGEAVYGIDVKIPQLRSAVYVRSPVLHARVKSWDATQAKALQGVEDVLQDVFGVPRVGHAPANEAAQPCPLPIHDLGELFVLSGRHPLQTRRCPSLLV